jgi:predicted deacetylase
MSGKLLLRLDDICPTMNWEIWQPIEAALCAGGFKPLVAVIPDNQDPTFHLAPARRDFWDQVRRWHALGWTIGVHGYQHAYVTRCSGLLGINRASEFAGLAAPEQERKIQLALGIFRSEGLDPKVWVAPSHSFDTITLQVLADVGLNVISDGFSLLPYQDHRGLFWVPQQMWRFRRVPFGVWTVCLHHNFWGPGAVARFGQELGQYRDQIWPFDEAVSRYRGRTGTAWDGVSALTLGTLLRLKQALRRPNLAVHPPEPAAAQ